MAPEDSPLPTTPTAAPTQVALAGDNFAQVWRDLRPYFIATFWSMLLLIGIFSLSMLGVIYKTTSAIEHDATEESKEGKPPELAQAGNAIIVHDSPKLRTAEAMALLTSLQISLAMALGFTCIFYGLLITCLGVTAGYDIKAGGNLDKSAAHFSIASSSPGILFLIGGLLLIGMALNKQIDYQDKTVVPYHGADLPPLENTVPPPKG